MFECIKTSSTGLSKADVWNLLLSCWSDVYCNIIGNSLSGSQGVCRQPRTGHRNRHNIPSLWLCNTSVCVSWLTDNGKTSPGVGGQPLCQIHKMWLTLRIVGWLLTIWIHDVSMYMSKYSSAVCLANQSWITVRTHSFVHICGTVTILELILFMHTCCYTCTNHLWRIVTAQMIYIVSCNSSLSKAEKLTLQLFLVQMVSCVYNISIQHLAQYTIRITNCFIYIEDIRHTMKLNVKQ